MKNRISPLLSVLLVLTFFLPSVILADPNSDPVKNYLKELATDNRFNRNSQGIISDGKTGLQWKEGPDKATNWNEAQEWIKSLGDGWRTPTRVELIGLYIETSQRLGSDNGIKTCPLDSRRLKLDSRFQSDKAYAIWAESKDETSAWYVSTTYGKEMYNTRDYSAWRYRALSVRSKK